MNKEKTMENARECYESLVASRIEIALLRLSQNSEYKEICTEEQVAETSLDSLLQKMTDPDRIMLKQYFETLSIKSHLELKEGYKQGIRDGVHFIDSLRTK